jgi:hypothetical protein
LVNASAQNLQFQISGAMAEVAFTAPMNGSARIAADSMSAGLCAGHAMRRRIRMTPVRAAVWMTSFIATLTTTLTAWACPDCEVGRAARQLAWEDSVAANLMIAVVPFALVAMVSLWAERIGRAR